MVSTQCKAAVSKAQMKLKSMEAHLETQREKNENAADPVEFKNAKDKGTTYFLHQISLFFVMYCTYM